MSETSSSSHYKDFVLTQKGLELRQQAVAGDKSGEKYILNFTRGAIGQGRPQSGDDVYYMTNLIDPSADVPIKESFAKDTSHIMTIVIDNVEFEEDIVMTEMAIFARLVNAKTGSEVIPEVMYGYTYTDKYDYIPSGGKYFLYREISFDTILSREGTFQIVYDKSKVYVTHKELADFLDSMGWPPQPIETDILHDLGSFPSVTVLEVIGGYGLGGYGEGPYGGGVLREVQSIVDHLDENKLLISLMKRVTGMPVLTRLGRNRFLLRYPDTSFLLVLNDGVPETYGECEVFHGLNSFPIANVLEVHNGYGMGGYGEGSYGGEPSNEVESRVIYIDRNRIRISLMKKASGTPSVTRASRNEFVIRYHNAVFFLVLFDGVNSQQSNPNPPPAVIVSGVTTFNDRSGDVTLYEYDIPNAIARKADIDKAISINDKGELIVSTK